MPLVHLKAHFHDGQTTPWGCNEQSDRKAKMLGRLHEQQDSNWPTPIESDTRIPMCPLKKKKTSHARVDNYEPVTWMITVCGSRLEKILHKQDPRQLSALRTHPSLIAQQTQLINAVAAEDKAAKDKIRMFLLVASQQDSDAEMDLWADHKTNPKLVAPGMDIGGRLNGNAKEANRRYAGEQVIKDLAPAEEHYIYDSASDFFGEAVFDHIARDGNAEALLKDLTYTRRPRIPRPRVTATMRRLSSSVELQFGLDNLDKWLDDMEKPEDPLPMPTAKDYIVTSPGAKKLRGKKRKRS